MTHSLTAHKDMAVTIILSSLPCNARDIELPSDEKRKVLRTLKNRGQIVLQDGEYVLNPDYQDARIKSKILKTVQASGTIRLSIIKHKLGCSRSAAYEAVSHLIRENKVQVMAKDNGRFLVSI